LLSFTGQAKEGSHELTWVTAEEKNIAGFDLERSNDGRAFSTIGNVVTGGTQNNTYRFTDKAPAEENNFYRLKILEQDGGSSYSTYYGNTLLLYPKTAYDKIQ
jgi:trimeric autotransporter adhesin